MRNRLFVPILMGLTAVTLLSGCVGLRIGGGTTTRAQSPTVGRQLIDLQKARDAGIITEAEYQSQKAKVLGSK